MTREVTYLNPHAGKTGRDGGPYLDQVEREFAEKNRARVEGREPDLENATFSVGVPATPDFVVAGRPDVVSHPSMLNEAVAGSKNDGAEVLPVDDSTEAPDEGEVSDFSASGSVVGTGAAYGEVVTNGDASINSPLIPSSQNNPTANSGENVSASNDPSTPAATEPADYTDSGTTDGSTNDGSGTPSYTVGA